MTPLAVSRGIEPQCAYKNPSATVVVTSDEFIILSDLSASPGSRTQIPSGYRILSAARIPISPTKRSLATLRSWNFRVKAGDVASYTTRDCARPSCWLGMLGGYAAATKGNSRHPYHRALIPIREPRRQLRAPGWNRTSSQPLHITTTCQCGRG